MPTYQIHSSVPADIPRKKLPKSETGTRPSLETDSGNPRLAAALWYALDLGWYVYPIYEPAGINICSCRKGRDCPDPGKHPRITRGFNAATRDEQQIRAWWEKWPNANVGIATGARSGIVAIDVDPRHGGDESLADLERIHGPLPETVEQLSGRGDGGGMRLYRHPGCRVPTRWNHPAHGIDVRGDGGGIVAHPSIHAATGGTYEWDLAHHPDEVEIAPLPDWLRDAITDPGPTPCPPHAEGVDTSGNAPSMANAWQSHADATHPQNNIPQDAAHMQRRCSADVAHGENPETAQKSPGKRECYTSDLPPLMPSNPDCVASATAGWDCVADEGHYLCVATAIKKTQPESYGHRRDNIFRLCRRLQGMARYAGLPKNVRKMPPEAVDDLRAILKRWHKQALPNIRTKRFEASWEDFQEAWEGVKYPAGTGNISEILTAVDQIDDPPCAAQFQNPGIRRLIRICIVLQRRAGDSPFYLTGRVVDEELGVHFTTVHRWLKELRARGILSVAKEFRFKDRLTNEYHFTGDMQ